MEDQPKPKMFIVAILCHYTRSRLSNTFYGHFMYSGVNEDKRGKFSYGPDRTKAQKFAKLTAESLVERLQKNYRLTARVEPEEESL